VVGDHLVEDCHLVPLVLEEVAVEEIAGAEEGSVVGEEIVHQWEEVVENLQVVGEVRIIHPY
jgi:hypothetical protein